MLVLFTLIAAASEQPPLVAAVHGDHRYVLGTNNARGTLDRRDLVRYEFVDAEGWTWSQRSAWERFGNGATYLAELDRAERRQVPLEVLAQVFSFAPVVAMSAYAIQLDPERPEPVSAVPYVVAGVASAALGIGLRVHVAQRERRLRADIGLKGLSMAESAILLE